MKETRHMGTHIVWCHLYDMSRKGKPVETVDYRLLGAGVGTWINSKGTQVSYWDDENVLKLICGDGYTTRVNLPNITELYNQSELCK